MNFKSCDRCGVVIDLDQLIAPAIYNHDTGELIREDAVWVNDDGWRPAFDCPVCDARLSFPKTS